MKKVALLSMLLGLGLFAAGCSETKPAPKPPSAPTQGTPMTPPEDPNAAKPADDMPKDGAEENKAGEPAGEDKPAGEEKPADEAADEKPADEK